MPGVSRNQYVRVAEAMPCPQCKSPTQVKETRGTGNNSIRRRRRCTGCGLTFTTLETFAAFDGRQGRTPLTKPRDDEWMDETRAFAALIPVGAKP